MAQKEAKKLKTGAGQGDGPAQLLAGEDGHLQLLQQILARLERIEGKLGGTEKGIEGRVRRLDLQMQAVLRRLYLDDLDLPFPQRLTVQRFGILSQNGEDGLTLALFKQIGTTNCRFVEIGCGSNGGNSGMLAKEFGWSGLMIDGNEHCIEVIGRRFSGCAVTALAERVTRENVDSILRQHGFTGEIDLLSIDIDGNDYWVWEALTVCSPRVVIVEYNSLFGLERAVVVPYDPDFDRHKLKSMYFGASLAALAHLAAQKGYRLVTTEPVGANAYFLRNDLDPSIPACPVREAYRRMEKDGMELSKTKDDVYRYIQQAGLPLVEVG